MEVEIDIVVLINLSLIGAMLGLIAGLGIDRNAQMGLGSNIVTGIGGAIIGGVITDIFFAVRLAQSYAELFARGNYNSNDAILAIYVGAIAGAIILLSIVARIRLQNLKNDLPKQAQKLQSSVSPKVTSGTIFLSYRRADSADISGRIYDRLMQAFGRVSVFKDVDSIPLGTDFKKFLDEQVSKCNVLLAIIGDTWLEARDAKGNIRLKDPRDFVRIEIECALERDIPVIPLLVRGASMPSEEVLPAGLKKLAFRNGIAIRPDPDFHRDMDRLISALSTYINPKH